MSGGRAGNGFEPLSPQNSTGNRILRASNDNLASAAFELGRRERIELMLWCERGRTGEEGANTERERKRERRDKIDGDRKGVVTRRKRGDPMSPSVPEMLSSRRRVIPPQERKR